MSLNNTLISAITRTPARPHAKAATDLGPTVKPAYEIKETEDAFGVTVQ